MVSVGRHENITLLSNSEVESVAGYVGNFTVRVRRKPRYVDEFSCTGCGTCVEKCPWKNIPSEFDHGLGTRAAIYFPFAQAVPRVPIIDRENCAYFQKGKCRACEKFCQTGSINFEQKEEYIDLEAGAIILATGFKDFDARRIEQYGYGTLDNVVTSMELERLINTGGPTTGEVLMKDGRKPESIAIVHCVGSRNNEFHEYCSRVCCMYSLKLAQLVRDYVGAEVHEYYRDMRAFGKGYEAFYERVERAGVHFTRFDQDVADGGLHISRHNGQLKVTSTDLYSGEPNELLVDMVVLSTGIEPQSDASQVAQTFSISRGPDGFFLEKHPKLAPVETTTDGVYLAGTCQGPKDIPDSVAQGGAAASAALSLMDAGHVTLDPFTTFIDQSRCGGCRTCEGLCPYHAIEMVEMTGRLVAYVNEVLCKGCGACAAACPAQAAIQNGFTQDQILAEIEGVLSVMNLPVMPKQEVV
jgi:heterodisulfide reductase subunit A